MALNTQNQCHQGAERGRFKMFSCYDQRPTSEIIDYLMATNIEEIDLLAVVTVLCKRIETLEHNQKALLGKSKNG